MTRITIRANPGARENRVEKIDEKIYRVSVTDPPIQGRANKAVIKTLAEYFKTSPSKIFIVSGLTSKIKILEIS